MDFEKIVKSALEAGMTPEQFAADITKALNEAIEEQEKKASCNKKEEYLIDLLNKFENVCDCGDWVDIDVYCLATYLAALKHPNWTYENCLEFYDYISLCMTKGADLIGASFEDMMKTILNELFGRAREKKQETSKKNDFESVKDFFGELGLKL